MFSFKNSFLCASSVDLVSLRFCSPAGSQSAGGSQVAALWDFLQNHYFLPRSLQPAQSKEERKTICGVQDTAVFELSFCHWGVTDDTNSACLLRSKLGWQKRQFSCQNSRLQRLEGITIHQSSPLVSTQSLTAVSTRCPDTGVKSP